MGSLHTCSCMMQHCIYMMMKKKKKCDIKACVWLLQTQTKAVIDTAAQCYFVLSVHYKASFIFLCCVFITHSQENSKFVFLIFFTACCISMQNEGKISWNQKSDVQVVSMCTYKYHHLVCWYLCVTIHVLKTQMTNNSKHAGVHSEGDLSLSETYSFSGLHSQNLICHEDKSFFF